MAYVSGPVADPVELLRLHVEALFRRTPDGRLIESNETPPEPAPRVFVGRTTSGVVCHVHRDVPAPLAAEVAGLAASVPVLPTLAGDPAAYAAIEAAVAAAASVAERSHGPAYVFAEPPHELHADVVVIGPERRDALTGPFAVFASQLEHIAPFHAIVRDGAVVSACYCARRTGDAAEAGVDTHPDHRGKGFATAVVNAWRIAIEASGRTALYSTDFDNASSQAVARRLGLRQYAETLSLT